MDTNKFESVVKYIGNNPDILTVSEIKVDDTSPESEVLFEVISTSSRSDCTGKGGGILLYIREGIPSEYLRKIANN